MTEAAWILETTVDALRKRVQRGTVPHERDEYGRVWIMVDTDRTRQDTPGLWPDTDRSQSELDVLISEMRGRIEDLRAQLEAERQGHAESRRLLAAALERIPPQIEAPRDERESPTEAAADTESTESLSSTPGPQERISRPWWRRMFGG